MPHIIRPYTAQDIPGITQTVKEVYDEYNFSWDPDSYHRDLYHPEEFFHPPSQLFVAQCQGTNQIDAICGLEVFPTPIPGQIGQTITHQAKIRVAATQSELVRLYVRPAARRQGLATNLTKQVMSLAQALGHTHLEIWSDKHFSDAHRLYQTFGASIVGERICDDPDEAPEWGMILPLNSNQ